VARAEFNVGLVVAEMFCVRPNAVTRHFESLGQWLPPIGSLGWLAPVVGYLHRFPVLQLADGDISIEAPISVVASPLDHDRIADMEAPSYFQRQRGEVALDFCYELATSHDLTHLWPLPHDVVSQWNAEEVGDPGGTIGGLVRRDHTDYGPFIVGSQSCEAENARLGWSVPTPMNSRHGVHAPLLVQPMGPR
jgi:hypothetical protein